MVNSGVVLDEAFDLAHDGEDPGLTGVIAVSADGNVDFRW